MLKTALFFLFVSFTSFAQDLHDLIQPVRLTAGQPDSVLISDIYYSENYDVSFTPNMSVDVKYLPEQKIVVFNPSENFKGIELITFTSGGQEFVIPVIATQIFKRTFSYKPVDKPEKVNLFGSFNGWNRQAQPMTDDDNDGVYTTSVLIEPGRYEYKYFVDGKELVDNANPEKVSNGMGDFNSIITVKSPDTSKTFLHKFAFSSNNNDVVLSFIVSSNLKDIQIERNEVIAILDNKKIADASVLIVKDKINITLDKVLLSGYKTIRVALNENGVATNIQSVFLKDGQPVDAKDTRLNQSDIIYSLMLDRFNNGDKNNDNPVVHADLSPRANYMGGDFLGVIDKINSGYFDSLGINTLWLSPVVQNTDSAYQETPEPHRWYTGYHGYWPTHPTNVEEHFGDMNLLKKLISSAHSRHIKILLDYVAHHVHIEHPYWQNHRDWFGILDLPDGRKNLRLWDDYRLTTWFEPYMPSFDFLGSKTARDTMTDNALWWLKETGVDGFRHDAVKHVPNEFWRELTYKIKKDIEVPENKSIYQIGETFGSYDLISSYVNNGQLNAQFNFNLYDTAIPVFTDPNVSFSALDDQMQKTFAVYGVNHSMGNIMDSHDKVRFMAYADGDMTNSGNPDELAWNNPPKVDNKKSYDRLEVFLTYLLTVPGIPVIYYGDEFGMTGSSDPDNRRMMRFGSELTNWETEALADIRKIVSIRQNHSALKFGDYLTLKVDKDVYAYIRSDFNERVLVVLNKGKASEDVLIELPKAYTSNEAADLITGDKFLVNNNNLHLTLPSLGYKMFLIK